MHFIFIPYGKRTEVELLVRDMEAQKHKLTCHKEGEKDKVVWIQGQVRVLPFGIMEYVFPKDDLDAVLNTLCYEQYPNSDRYELEKLNFFRFQPLSLLRKFLKCERLPKEWKKDQKLLWIRDNVMIIPVGIRPDGEIVDSAGLFKGWTHEAI